MDLIEGSADVKDLTVGERIDAVISAVRSCDGSIADTMEVLWATRVIDAERERDTALDALTVFVRARCTVPSLPLRLKGINDFERAAIAMLIRLGRIESEEVDERDADGDGIEYLRSLGEWSGERP